MNPHFQTENFNEYTDILEMLTSIGEMITDIWGTVKPAFNIYTKF